jgi:hypothetical protein
MTPHKPSYFYSEVGLYQRCQLGTPEEKEALARIHFHTDPLDVYCVECEQQSIFRSTVELPNLGPGVYAPSPALSVDALLSEGKALLPYSDEDDGSVSHQGVIAYVLRPKYFTRTFVCSRNAGHELRFFIRVTDSYYEKVGQSPSLADLYGGDLAKYRKVLGSDYSELARGVGLYAHGVGVGSFVYLRRIFERQIGEAHATAASDTGWDEDAYQRSRMDDKILLLRSHLPDFVVENRAVYGVLSKGIHELGETECLEYFPAVRVAIELILDEKLKAREKAAKLEGSGNVIRGIVGKLKGK